MPGQRVVVVVVSLSLPLSLPFLSLSCSYLSGRDGADVVVRELLQDGRLSSIVQSKNENASLESAARRGRKEGRRAAPFVRQSSRPLSSLGVEQARVVVGVMGWWGRTRSCACLGWFSLAGRPGHNPLVRSHEKKRNETKSLALPRSAAQLTSPSVFFSFLSSDKRPMVSTLLSVFPRASERVSE